MAGPLVKVRTGPSSYLKMTEKDAAAYRAAGNEYGAPAQAEDAPEPAKPVKAPAKKSDG